MFAASFPEAGDTDGAAAVGNTSNSSSNNNSGHRSRSRRREQALTRSMQAAAAQEEYNHSGFAKYSNNHNNNGRSIGSSHSTAATANNTATNNIAAAAAAAAARSTNSSSATKSAAARATTLESSKRSSTSSMHKTRAHAKQIAMAISQDELFMSSSSSFADFGSAFGNTNNNSKKTAAGGRISSDPFAEFALDSQKQTKQQYSMFPPSTDLDEDFFQSAASNDFFAPPVVSSTQGRRTAAVIGGDHHNKHTSNTNTTIKASIVRVSATHASPAAVVVPKGGGIDRRHAENHVRSLPRSSEQPFATYFDTSATSISQQQQWPSNVNGTIPRTPERSRPDSQLQPQQSYPTSSPPPPPPAGAAGAAVPLSTGAAARRRVRTQMRKKEEATMPIKPTAGAGALGSSSPYRLSRSDSVGSGRHPSGATATPVKLLPPAMASSGSSSSDRHNQNNALFHANSKIGFSFDAFGLDGAEMQREVAEAVHALAVGSHPDISMFLQDSTTDDFVATSAVPPGGRQEPQQQPWDAHSNTSTTTYSINNNESTAGSLTSSTAAALEAADQSGFVDGFRVTKPPQPQQQQQPNNVVRKESPTRSERSSLTSESVEPPNSNGNGNNNGGSLMNMFKQQAGFHSSKPRKVVRPIGHDGVGAGARQTSGSRVGPEKVHSASLAKKINVPLTVLPKIPILNETSSKAVSSPIPQRRHIEAVEFYGEDLSSDDDAHLQFHPSGVGPSSERVVVNDMEPSSDGGVASEPDTPSDVGVSSDVNGGARSDIGKLPFIVGKDTKFHTRSSSVRTESTAATTTAEEKKDDESHHKPNVLSNLLSTWESRETSNSKKVLQKRIERQHVPSTLSKEHITRLQDQLGDDLLSPEKLMAPNNLSRLQSLDDSEQDRHDLSLQKRRSEECLDQRTSFASIKERLRSTGTRPDETIAKSATKSEGGAAVRHSSVSTILTNIEKRSHSSDTRSDSGGSPAVAYAVNLRGNGFRPGQPSPKAVSLSPSISRFKSGQSFGSPSRPTTGSHQGGQHRPFESQAMKLVRQQSDSPLQSPSVARSSPREPWSNSRKMGDRDVQQPSRRSPHPVSPRLTPTNPIASSDNVAIPSPKQLTYRERRLLELEQLKKEEDNRRAKEQPNLAAERDVAALIKQRIAASKKSSAVVASHSYDSGESEDITQQRYRLKPVSSNDDCFRGDQNEPAESQAPPGHTNEQRFDDNSYTSSQIEEARQITHDTDKEIESPRGRGQNSGAAHLDLHSSNRLLNIDPVVSTDSRVNSLEGDCSEENESSPTISQRPSNSTRRRMSDLVIETDDVETKPVTEKAMASAAVSHMLMLQQLQQRQPLESRNVVSRSSPKNEREAASKSVKSPAAAPASDTGTEELISRTPKATMMMLNAFLAGRESISTSEGPGAPALTKAKSEDEPIDSVGSPHAALPTLRDDPKYARYFKMISIGMPMEVVKHAMVRDGLDPSVLDCDHDKPVGIPLKKDPEYAKYFKMLSFGLPMEAVKHAMERDGLDSVVMDQDHDLPAATGKNTGAKEPKEKDSHRRARLHWKTLRKVTSNSLWAKIDQDSDLNIEIDEQEFQELFQAERSEAAAAGAVATSTQKRGSTVCVIDSKRANNGGIILARLKMSHDDMADAVDRIDEHDLTAEQIENVIEYLPTKEERKALETYMLEGGQDAAEKFDGLCECEKFMVSMMTVKHAKRKVSALLFKLQFESCIRDIQKEACAIEQACEELRSSSRLRQLLGIVLTFGNRLNTAGNGKRKAGAFTLDSLLKLNQAKAFDKKTTFLHYIILIVQRNNELLLNFKDDLPTVFSSDKIFWDQCVADLEEVENQLENVRKIALYQAHQAQSYRLRRKSKRDDPDESLSDADEALSLEEEVEALRSTPIGLFTLSAIKYVSALRDKIESTKVMFAHVLEYFGEDEKQLQPHELFSIIVSFSRDFDKAKEQVSIKEKLKQREERKRLASTSVEKTPTSGRPPASSPYSSMKKSVDTLKASNLQPSMSNVIQDLKSISSPLRKTSLGEMSGQNHVSPQRRNTQDIGGTRIRDDHMDASRQMSSPKMDFSRGLTHDQTITEEEYCGQIETNDIDELTRNDARVPPAPTNSSAASAMRARARARRQRGRMSPSSVDESVLSAENPQNTDQNRIDGSVDSKPRPRPSSPYDGDRFKTQPPSSRGSVSRSASDDSGAQPLSPKSNFRLKRRNSLRASKH